MSTFIFHTRDKFNLNSPAVDADGVVIAALAGTHLVQDLQNGGYGVWNAVIRPLHIVELLHSSTVLENIRRHAAHMSRGFIQQQRFCPGALTSSTADNYLWRPCKEIPTRDLQIETREDLHWKTSPVKSWTENRLCSPRNPVTEEPATARNFSQNFHWQVTCSTSKQRVHCSDGPCVEPVPTILTQ